MKVFICRIPEMGSPAALRRVLASMQPEVGSIILLPEYINYEPRPGRFIQDLERDISRFSLEKHCHVVTSFIRGQRNMLTRYFEGKPLPVYEKVGEDGTFSEYRRNGHILNESPWFEINGRRIYALCCMDYAEAYLLNIPNASIILIPAYMGSDDLGGGRAEGTLGGAFLGKQVFLSNKKDGGCRAFHSDMTGKIVESSGEALEYFTEIAV